MNLCFTRPSGIPRHPKGLISAPSAKVLIDKGKSDRITDADAIENVYSNHAVTEYEVIGYNSGYSWLELSPLTSRKHQVLGTSIVGNYKYGWRVHKRCKQLGSSNFEETSPNRLQREALPFVLDLASGSISDEEPRLHLHFKQILLPDVSSALKRLRSSSRQGLSELETLEMVAPLPLYMQKSVDILQQPRHTCEQSSMDRSELSVIMYFNHVRHGEWISSGHSIVFSAFISSDATANNDGSLL